MASLLKKIAGVFIYKEPSNKELGFELLEKPHDTGYEPEASEQQPEQKPEQDKQQPLQQGKAPQQGQQAQQRDKSRNSLWGNRRRNYRRPVGADEWIEKNKTEPTPPGQKDENAVSADLGLCLQTMQQKFSAPKNMDLVIREFNIGRKKKAFLVFLENMIDKKELNSVLLPDLMAKDALEGLGDECPVDHLMRNIITSGQIKKAGKFSDAITSILSGGGALFIEGCAECLLIQICGVEKRNVTTPKVEPVIKGAQEAFTESLDTNISLVRKIIKNEKLIVELITVGNMNHSYCAVMYVTGVVNQDVVKEVIKRIKSVNTSFIGGSGFLEQFIEDNPNMLFPQMLTTERPDRTAFLLKEGLVAVIADGTPFAAAAPSTFFRLMHTAEDPNLRWPFSSFLRLIRYLGLFCAAFLPGMYVALVLFHVEMIPTEMLVSIAKAKEMVPFPTVIEILILEVSFELIREGAVRVPGVIGQTLGIVGALILGQAAVAANLISPIMVIIVSLTSIGSFCIPSYEFSIAIRMLRFGFMFAGAFFGFYGITVLASIIMLFACSMKSFGVPFLTPVAPKTNSDSNTIIRRRVFDINERPDALNTPDRVKQGDNVENWTKKKPEPGGGSP